MTSRRRLAQILALLLCLWAIQGRAQAQPAATSLPPIVQPDRVDSAATAPDAAGIDNADRQGTAGANADANVWAPPPLAVDGDLSKIRFRRVGAPLNAPILSGLLPMRRDEFERLIEQLRGEASQQLQQSMLATADYEASLQPDGRLEGVARLAITHRESQAVLLPLNPWSLAVGSAIWEDDNSPAHLGCDPRGRVAVVVERRGVLRVSWSQPPLEEARFGWDLPWCADSTMQLDLPSGLQPHFNHGLATQSSAGIAPSAATRWTWHGHGGPLSVSLQPLDSQRVAQPWVSGNTTYRASTAGLEIETELRLDCRDAPQSQLLLRATAEMRVVQASLDGQAVDVVEDAARPQFFHLQFPQPLAGPDHVIKVQSFCRLTLDELWTLPVLLAPLAQWRQGGSEVFLDGALELHDALAQGCRQTSSANDASGRLLSFIHDREPPEIRLHLARRRPRLRVVSGTQVRWEGRQLQARVAADVEVDYGEMFAIQTLVREPWTVDSVSIQPEASLDANALTTRVEQERLSLPLSRPLRFQQPMRVIILAHRRAPDQDEGLSGDQLAVVRFPDAIETRELLTVDAEVEGAFALGDFPRLIGLSRRELDLLNPAPDALIFRHTDNLHQITVRPKSGPPRYTGEILVRVDARRALVEEAYEVRVDPRGGALQRLLLRFSQARDSAPSFWLKSASSVREIIARPILTAEPFDAADGEPATPAEVEAGEVWELDLPAGQTAPFQLTCQRRTPADRFQNVSLLSLPDAERSAARVILMTDVREPLSLATVGLQRDMAAPASTDPASAYSSFRYEPRKAAELRLVRSADASARWEEAWVWERRIHSRISDSGELLHRADFLVESLGRHPLTISLPETAAFRRLEWNGQPLDVAPSSATNAVVTPPLTQRFVRVTLYYVEHLNLQQGPVALRWTSRPPQINARVLSHVWRVTLAPTLAAWHSAADPSGASTWIPRLLGPLRAWTTSEPWSPWEFHTNDRTAPDLTDLLAKADSALVDLASDAQPTLGQWLQELLPVEELWVDERALTYQGLTPNTPLMPRRYTSGPQVLDAFGLQLQRRNERFLLTTADRPHRDDSVTWISAATWLDEPRRGSPWPAQADRGHLGMVTSDGRSLSLLDGETIVVLRSNWLQAVAWCVVLAAAGLGIMLWWWRPVSPMVMALACALAALQLPNPLAALFAAAGMWGALLAAAIGFCRSRPREAQEATPAWPVGVKFLLLMTGLGGGLGAAWSASASQLPPSTSDRSSASSTIHEVVSLLDENGKPADDYVYMAAEFQDALLRAEQRAQQADAWLLTHASYTFRPESQEPEPTAGQVTALLGYWVNKSNAVVHCPIPAPGLELLEATINGRPATVAADPQSGMLTWRPGEAGEHRLRLTWRLPLELTAAPGRELAVHSSPSTVLEIVDAGDRLLRWDEKLLRSGAWDLADRRWRAELGPVRRLQLPGSQATGPVAKVEVDALYWLRIRPKSVMVDAHLHLQSSNGEFDTISVVADPSLTPHRVRCEQLENTEATSEATANGVRWTWRLPVAVADARIEISFLCKGLTGVGVTPFPRIAPDADQVLRRWAAVSVHSGLVLDSGGLSLPGRAIPPTRFAQDWQGDEVPDLALELTDDALPSIPVRFAASRLVANETLDVVARMEVLELRYRAQISGGDSLLPQLRLEIPPGLTNLRVRLDDARGELPVRTSRAEHGELLAVFLDRPAQEEQTLTIDARLPLSGADGQKAQRRLPIIELQGCEASHYELRISRGSDASDVSLTEIAGLIPVEAVADAPHRPDQRLMHVYRREPTRGALSATLAVRPNQALADGSLMTRMKRAAGVWTAELQVQATVRQGVLDTLWLETPSNWGPPFSCQPAAEITLHEAPEVGRRFLAIKPAEPVPADGVVQFTVDAAVNQDGGNSPPSAPDIAPLNFAPRVRHVALPIRDGQQPIAWEISGLQAVRAPTAAAGNAEEGDDAYDFYRVTSSPFQATRMRIEPVSAMTRVRLAEHHFLCDPAAGTALGLTTLLIEPGGRLKAVLASEGDIDILSVRIDGQPAVAAPLDARRWQLNLRHDQLPQQIEVLYAQVMPADGESVLACLTIVDASVLRSSLMVSPPIGARVDFAAASDAVEISRGRAQLARRQSWVAALQAASEVYFEEPADVQRQWGQVWSGRLELPLPRPSGGRDVEQAQTDLAARQQQLVSQLGIGGNWPPPEYEPLVLSSADQLWTHLDNSRAPRGLTKEGVFDRVRVEFESRASNLAAANRHLASALLLALSLLGMQMRRWTCVQELFLRSPATALVMVGAAWWLVFSPSFAGWLLIAVAIVSAWRFPWPRRYL